MSNLVKALIGLAALAFVLAVLSHFTGSIVRTQPEAYSRASANLALLAIALVLTFGGRRARADRFEPSTLEPPGAA